MKPIVLDASALLTLQLATDGKRELLMSVINWGEIYYACALRGTAILGRALYCAVTQSLCRRDRPLNPFSSCAPTPP